MSDDHPTNHQRVCGGDVAAYALGALEPPEAESFARHLDGCTICRDELESFQHVVDVVALTVPRYRAPRKLRRRVRRAIADEPRLDRARQTRQRRIPSFSLPALGGGLAVSAVIAALAIVLTSGGGSVTRVVAAQVTGRGSARLLVSHDHAELVVRHFAQPPSGRIYEVWLVRGRRAPAPTNALFAPTSSGSGDVDVPGSLRGVTRVLVTPEPVGGSQVPTHAPVIAAKLA